MSAAVLLREQICPAVDPAEQIRYAKPSRLKLFLLALASGLLLFCCHFPLAWGWLGWVALVPLLPLIRVETGSKWRYFCAWVAASAYFWPAISWMTVADTRMIACWAMLSFYCSLYFPLAIYLVRRLDLGTQLPLLATFPAVWIALEFARCFVLTGFPWYLLAHTQHDVLAVIQIADLGGAFAVSLLVAAINVMIYEGLERLPLFRRWLGLPTSQPARCCQPLVLQFCVVALMLGGTLGYGVWCLSQDETDPGPRIALIQGNLDQRLRIAAHRSAEAKAKVEAAYLNLCLQASKLEPPPTLIVWPETSFPTAWATVAAGESFSNDPKFQSELKAAQEYVLMIGPICKTNVLLGVNTQVYSEQKTAQGGSNSASVGEEPPMRRFNSGLLVDAKGIPVKRYDKIHRVPFGEYVPFRDWLPFMNALAPYEEDYSIGQGDGLTRFTLDRYRFGVLICFEDTDPFMARDYGIETRDGPAVHFLINLSNDGWFDGSSEHEEHLAISRFRAIESRRALLRSVNMGISVVIDSSGRVLAPIKRSNPAAGSAEVWEITPSCSDLPESSWHQYKQTEGIIVVDVPIDRRTSLYATYGDWLPYSCWALVGGGLAWGWFRRAKSIKVRN